MESTEPPQGAHPTSTAAAGDMPMSDAPQPRAKLPKPNAKLFKTLQRYRDIGAVTNKISYASVRGPHGFQEDLDRLTSDKPKPGKAFPPGHLTGAQLKAINDRERTKLKKIDPEYATSLNFELEAKRIRANALMKIVFPLTKPPKIELHQDTDTLDKEKRRRDGKLSRAQRLEILRKEIDNSLLAVANTVAENTTGRKQKGRKVQSTAILVLRSKIAALTSSIEGDSYAVKGGLPKLPSEPLCYALAASYLQRYVDGLKESKQALQKQISGMEADIAFERRLVAELKLMSSVAKFRSSMELSNNAAFFSSPLSTINRIARQLNKNLVIVEQESTRLMACLKYLVDVHIAPYICLHAHRAPTFEDLTQSTGKANKRRNTAGLKLQLSHELKARPTEDMSDVGAVATRVQTLLTSLLNNSLNSKPNEILCTELKVLTDPIVRLFFNCNIIVHPFSNAYMISLRDFGVSSDDRQ